VLYDLLSRPTGAAAEQPLPMAEVVA
jgi:hypothetical protein